MPWIGSTWAVSYFCCFLVVLRLLSPSVTSVNCMQKGKSSLSDNLMLIYLKGGAVVTGRRLRQVSFIAYEGWCLFLLLLFKYSFHMWQLYGWLSQALSEFCKGTVGGEVCHPTGVLLLCIALCTGVWVQHCGSEIKLWHVALCHCGPPYVVRGC